MDQLPSDPPVPLSGVQMLSPFYNAFDAKLKTYGTWENASAR